MQMMGFMGGPHPRDAGLRGEPSLPGRSGTDSTARDGLDAADLHWRLGSKDATATEARFARPNVQVAGNTVHDHPATFRQDAEQLTGDEAEDMAGDSNVDAEMGVVGEGES